MGRELNQIKKQQANDIAEATKKLQADETEATKPTHKEQVRLSIQLKPRSPRP